MEFSFGDHIHGRVMGRCLEPWQSSENKAVDTSQHAGEGSEEEGEIVDP